MIDLKRLEKDQEQAGSYFQLYSKALQNRGADVSALNQLMTLNQRRKELIQESETAKASQNKVSQDIARMKKSGEDASAVITEMQGLSRKVKDLETQRDSVEAEVEALLLTLPNHCHESTPVGKDETQNQVVRTVGEISDLDFEPKEHDELGLALGLMDFERAGKVTGARFVFLMGAVARLERALINFMLDLHTAEHGYTEVLPPYIVNSDSMQGTGQFPKFKDDAFHLEGTDQHLIPTAEVPVTNFYRDDILTEEQLPTAFVAFSPCFRAEAGSHGRDTKGLIRQHQFHKVELLKFVHPDNSYEEHEKLTQNAEEVLKRLELPYRVVALCTGDIGFAAAKCYDLEVWLPSQKAYREISSCSNFEDFQARRANIRFRPSTPKAKPQFVHTLNGSGLAVGRTLLAIMENHQQKDGSIRIPKALQPYMGGLEVIR